MPSLPHQAKAVPHLPTLLLLLNAPCTHKQNWTHSWWLMSEQLGFELENNNVLLEEFNTLSSFSLSFLLHLLTQRCYLPIFLLLFLNSFNMQIPSEYLITSGGYCLQTTAQMYIFAEAENRKRLFILLFIVWMISLFLMILLQLNNEITCNYIWIIFTKITCSMCLLQFILPNGIHLVVFGYDFFHKIPLQVIHAHDLNSRSSSGFLDLGRALFW